MKELRKLWQEEDSFYNIIHTPTLKEAIKYLSDLSTPKVDIRQSPQKGPPFFLVSREDSEQAGLHKLPQLTAVRSQHCFLFGAHFLLSIKILCPVSLGLCV